ncbi:SHOCT domain-containing protein [Thiohalomonas denitrificans]|uniref:SHOCT domain-containing protein n=1 Tax=Thiohalomonas denitrificans TaxID=415747 RepID=UPI0026EC24DD|nr:SHOCT domain-containing protein [Thiohalomonas denitrificans]
MHDGFGFGFGGFMWIFWILLILLVIWAVGAFRGGEPRATRRTPLQILEERYARGEIDKEEFERKRDDLRR